MVGFISFPTLSAFFAFFRGPATSDFSPARAPELFTKLLPNCAEPRLAAGRKPASLSTVRAMNPNVWMKLPNESALKRRGNLDFKQLMGMFSLMAMTSLVVWPEPMTGWEVAKNSDHLNNSQQSVSGVSFNPNTR